MTGHLLICLRSLINSLMPPSSPQTHASLLSCMANPVLKTQNFFSHRVSINTHTHTHTERDTTHSYNIHIPQTCMSTHTCIHTNPHTTHTKNTTTTKQKTPQTNPHTQLLALNCFIYLLPIPASVPQSQCDNH